MNQEEQSIQFQQLKIKNNGKNDLQQNYGLQSPSPALQHFYVDSQVNSLHSLFSDLLFNKETKRRSYENEESLLHILKQSPFDNQKTKYTQIQKLSSIQDQQNEQYSSFDEKLQPKRKSRNKSKISLKKSRGVRNTYQQLCRALLRCLKKSKKAMKYQELLAERNKFMLTLFIRQNIEKEEMIQIILKNQMTRELELGDGSSSQKIFNIQQFKILTKQIIKQVSKNI